MTHQTRQGPTEAIERATHTPGPWKIGKSFLDQHKNSVTPIDAPDPACPACGRGEGTWLVAWLFGNAVPKAQGVANARLIAAAPRLAKALEGLLDAGTPEAITAAYAEARAALAEAFGTTGDANAR